MEHNNYNNYNNYNSSGQPNGSTPEGQPNGYYGGQRPFFHNPGLGMASASLFLGLGAVFTILAVFPPLAFGGLAIIFALLSKGYGKKLLTQAKIGLICGLAGIGITAAMFVSTFVTIIRNPDMLVQIGQQYDAACEQMYGQPTEDVMGYSFEEIMGEYADMLRR